MDGPLHYFCLQFFLVYIIVLGFALLGVWILNIALYISVKRRPVVPSGTIQRQQASQRKSRTSWVSQLPLIGKSLSKASGPKSTSAATQLERRQSRQQISRKHLELSLARTVLYVVVAFSLALLPNIIAIGFGRASSLIPSGPKFSPLDTAAWNGLSYSASRILFLNSFVNVIIYSYRSESFRIALKNLFICSK